MRNIIPQPEIQERITFNDEHTRDRFVRQARACGEAVRLEYVNTLVNGKELYNIYREKLVYGVKDEGHRCDS